MSSTQLEHTVASLVEKSERRFYGKYRGFVVDNEDPKKLARVTVKVPSVLGNEVVTGWAAACLPYGGMENQGLLFVPEKEAGVWVEFEEGDPECPIWVGTFWCQPKDKSEIPKPNDVEGVEEDEVQAPAVTRKIIKTKKGHTIQMEDKDDEEMVLIVQVKDDEKRNVISLTAEGITLLQKIEAENSNKVEMTASGIKLTDLTGNVIDMSDSAFTITSKVAFTIDASEQAVEIKGSTVDFIKI